MITHRTAAAALLALSLAGCSAHNGMLAASPPSFVNNVEVSLTKPMGSPALAETIRTKTLAEASRYGTTGQPKTLRVSVFQMHKKSPAMSFWVGDSNYITTNMTVVDGTTQAEEGKKQVKTISDALVNGVMGAVMAADQTDAEVEDKLTTKLAADLMEHVYGSKAAKIARKNPPALSPPATPVPGPAGTPTVMNQPNPPATAHAPGTASR